MPSSASHSTSLTPDGVRRRMPRRRPEETRELMIAAAVSLIRERALATGDEVLAAALAHVRLTRVAERATELVRAKTQDDHATAITTGAIYQLWPTQADFQVDVLFHIAELQSVLVPGVPDSLRYFWEASEKGRPLADVLAEMMEQVHRHYREDPMYRVELSFLLGAMDPRLRDALQVRQLTFYESVDQVYLGMLDAYGLRMREPYQVRDLSRAIAAQIAGSVVTWFADADIVADPLGEPNRSLMSRTIVAIFDSLTEPDPARISDQTHT